MRVKAACTSCEDYKKNIPAFAVSEHPHFTNLNKAQHRYLRTLEKSGGIRVSACFLMESRLGNEKGPSAKRKSCPMNNLKQSIDDCADDDSQLRLRCLANSAQASKVRNRRWSISGGTKIPPSTGRATRCLHDSAEVGISF